MGSGEFAVNANKLSTRGSINSQSTLSHRGSGPTWDRTFWRALGRDPVMQGMGALFDNEATAFASTFASEVGSRVGGMAQGVWNAVTSPIQTYNHVVDTTAAFVAQGMKERDARGWGGNSNNAMSAWEGAGYLVGSSIGANSLGEAGYGVGLMGNELSTEERWTRGFAGAGSLLLTAAGGAASYNPAFQTFKAGGKGFEYVNAIWTALESSDPLGSVLMPGVVGSGPRALSHIPNPMVEVTRTTPSALIAESRGQFNSVGRARFVREFGQTSEAQAFFTQGELTRMGSGKLPDGWVVHHKQPLFRGGDNFYDNLMMVPEKWHTDNSFNLHFYPQGKNPFGRN